MLKHLSIFAILVTLGIGSANAQQREAVIQKIEVPNANFDIVLATAKPGSPALYYQDQPDPNVVYLGSNLVIAYTEELAELLDITTLLQPAYTIVAERGEMLGRTAAVVYFVPKRKGLAAAAIR